MNIFILDSDPRKAAEYHCNKHVVKMILETSQMLSTAHHILGTTLDKLLLDKQTHVNHPCSVWVRESLDNYNWLHTLGIFLLSEYTNRYGKHHSKESLIQLLKTPPIGLHSKGLTPFKQAMPDQYKSNNAITAYRNYYIGEKAYFAKWKNNIPEWWIAQ